MDNQSNFETHVAKRRGHSELFSEAKLAESIRRACIAVRTPIGEAEITASRICGHVAEWLQTKEEITAADIRRKAAQHLAIYNPHAAILYQHHGVIS